MKGNGNLQTRRKGLLLIGQIAGKQDTESRSQTYFIKMNTMHALTRGTKEKIDTQGGDKPRLSQTPAIVSFLLCVNQLKSGKCLQK
jgi:hypothetical protein